MPFGEHFFGGITQQYIHDMPRAEGVAAQFIATPDAAHEFLSGDRCINNLRGSRQLSQLPQVSGASSPK